MPIARMHLFFDNECGEIGWDIGAGCVRMRNMVVLGKCGVAGSKESGAR
jgi:hypothetical protein